MTCIVGVVSDDQVLLGGDSAGVSNGTRLVRADAKVFLVDRYAFGFTSSFRMGQLLRYKLKPPTAPDPTGLDDDLVDAFMAVDFIDAVRQCLKDGGYATKGNEREGGGTFLVGVAGRLYRVDSDYQIGRTVQGWDAIGSGWEVALGSLHTSAAAGWPPIERVGHALSAAADYCTGVCPPFNVVLAPALVEASA